jgi:hypothetical protein
VTGPASSRRWLAGILVLVACAEVLAVLALAAHQADAPWAVTCRVRDDARRREFVLRRSDAPPAASGALEPVWQLSMREAESKGAWIDLLLPGAKPALTAGTAKLSYRNANGGRQVDLEVSPSGSRLDVWVDHGLEVNVEPDLDPRVDRLSTDGPITAVDCTIGPPVP